MTTYGSPFDSQNQTDLPSDAINGWQLPNQSGDQQLPFSARRGNWQIVPPIIADRRMAALHVQNAPSQERQGRVYRGQTGPLQSGEADPPTGHFKARGRCRQQHALVWPSAPAAALA